MSTGDTKFAPPSEAAVTRLVVENPLAWIVSRDDGGFCATPLPLRPVLDAQGTVERLIGHFARSNRHVQVLARDPRALILFMGPHGYVSPSWMRDRTQAPTWNYAYVQYDVDIRFVDDETQLEEVLRDLVGAMETGRPHAWGIEEMGPRYRRLASGVIAFEALIRARRVRFKMGQDERDDVYADILAGLEKTGGHTLRDWMLQSNPGRGRR